MSHRHHDADDYGHHDDDSEHTYSDEEIEERERAAEHASLTSTHRDEQKGLTKLLGNPNGASIASNGSAFGGRAADHDDDDGGYNINSSGPSGGGGGGGVREGMELEDDDGDEEIEIDSDLEDEIPRPSDDPHAGEVEAPQKCANWLVLYGLGVLMCMACEFLILLPAYYLRLFAIALLYAVVYIIVASCAYHMLICPGKRKPHSHLSFALYLAAMGAFGGGVGGAYYYKQYWYFDRLNTAYVNVNPLINPYTGVDYTGDRDWTATKSAEPLGSPVTFVEFELNMDDTMTRDPTVGAVNVPMASYVQRANGVNNQSITVGIYQEPLTKTTYCASAVLNTHQTWHEANVYGAATPKIFYWAIGEDCCGDRADGSVDHRYVTCPYWGLNVPGSTETVTGLSAEVLEDPGHQYYRKAIANFLEQAGMTSTRDGGDQSFLVRVMTLNDHYGNQVDRTRKAWACLLVGAFCWPILFLIWLAGVWCWAHRCTCCCSVKDRFRLD